jgi:hypothetical protein
VFDFRLRRNFLPTGAIVGLRATTGLEVQQQSRVGERVVMPRFALTGVARANSMNDGWFVDTLLTFSTLNLTNTQDGLAVG